MKSVLMNKKKIIYVIITFLLVITIILLSINLHNRKNKSFVICLGNPINNQEIDETFTSSFMDSSFLLKLLENDSSKNINNKIVKLSNHIKSSSLIIINLGNFEISNLIKENKVLTYDYELLGRQRNVLLDNIPKIIESIRNLNHLANISIYPLTYSFNFNDEYLIDFYKNINDSFKNISNQYKLNFLEK